MNSYKTKPQNDINGKPAERISAPPQVSDKAGSVRGPEEQKSLNEALIKALNDLCYGRETVDTVKRLLRAGADANLKDGYGRAALMLSVDSQNAEAVKLMIAHGADVNTTSENESTALMGAALLGNKEIVELLIEKGAEVNAKNTCGCTALIAAAQWSRVEATKPLIDAGAELDAKDSKGRTALWLASRAVSDESAQVVKMLVEAGAELGEVEKNNDTLRLAINRFGLKMPGTSEVVSANVVAQEKNVPFAPAVFIAPP
jgi:uncharacterized protein